MATSSFCRFFAEFEQTFGKHWTLPNAEFGTESWIRQNIDVSVVDIQLSHNGKLRPMPS